MRGLNKRRLPEASRQFTDAIAMGGETIRAYEKRRQARLRAGMLAAACAVILIGAGAYLFTHTRPRPDNVVLSADPGRLTSAATAAPEVVDLSWAEKELIPYDFVQVCRDTQFYKSPSADSPTVNVAEGTLATWLGEAEGGFVKARFGGHEGYFRSEDLRDIRGTAVTFYAGDRATPVTAFASPGAEPSEALFAIPANAAVACDGTIELRETTSAWAHVRYEGRTGWVPLSQLHLLPDTDDAVLESAQIRITMPNGMIYGESAELDGSKEASRIGTDDPAYILTVLQRLLRSAVPAVTGQCPQGALLEATLNTGETLRFTMPTDGCTTLICENLAVFDFSPEESGRFWELFGDCAAEMEALS